MRVWHHLITTLLILAIAVACEASHARDQEENRSAAGDAGVVDSIFPIEEEVRRFRAALPEHPETLGSTSPTREALIRRFVAALEASDTAELRRMALTRSEFAYLYYPTTQFAAPPYDLSPALVWYRLESYSSRGLTRALARFGGRPLEISGHACEAHPMVQGENRIWHGCVVISRSPDGRSTTLSLFGPILERGGEFKMLSFANGI